MRPPRPSGSDRNKRQNSKKDDGFRVNEDIRAPQIRLIDEEGKMLGVMSPYDALRQAQARGLDLIEIGPNASPPTCKIMDYGKWKYENKKKAAISKKKQTVINIKEVQVRPRTDDHDVDVKLRNARRFILEGDKVKFNLRFQGREMAYQDQGFALLEKITARMIDIAVVETPVKREGRQMFTLLAPDPAKIKEYLKANPQLKKAAPKNDAKHEEDEVKEA